MTTYRVRVTLTSELGNPREIVTLCKTKVEAEGREAMYRQRYVGVEKGVKAEIFIEEVSEKQA